MQDLWEIMGRLITTKAFRDSIFGEASLAGKNKAIPCAIEVASTKYAKLADLLRTKIQNGPVSVFARGEMLRVLPFRTFQASVEKLAGLAPANSDAGSVTFQTALGILTIDTKYRDKFRDFALSEAQADFAAMTRAEFDTLKNLIADKNGPYSVSATGMCNEEWDPICHGILVPYENSTQRHPVTPPPPGFLI